MLIESCLEISHLELTILYLLCCGASFISLQYEPGLYWPFVRLSMSVLSVKSALDPAPDYPHYGGTGRGAQLPHRRAELVRAHNKLQHDIVNLYN